MKKSAEVVIIGGGCMGASVAFHLARRGVKDVVLVEREPWLAMGSTGRNAGGFRHQFSSELNVKLSIESIRLMRNFKEAVGYEIDFHPHGYLFLLSNENDVAAFRQNIEMQRRLGIEVELITPDDAKKLARGLKTDGLMAASFCPQDGIADPNGVTLGFAKAAQAAGVDIVKETVVTGIKTTNHKVTEVETTQGTIATPRVVNAAGPLAREIGQMVGLDIPVLPFRRHIFITEPLGERAHLAPTSRIMVIDFATTFYFHREGAGVLFGMSDRDEPTSFNLSVSWEFLEKVYASAAGRLPVLTDLGIAHAWAGLYEVSPDGNPIIDEAETVKGFYMINGFSGHGFQHSPAAGRLLADLMIDGVVKDLDISPFSFTRFANGESQGELNVV
ncbi:MAG: FAD-binding oxidoreductase [Acidobacteriota bacterium]